MSVFKGNRWLKRLQKRTEQQAQPAETSADSNNEHKAPSRKKWVAATGAAGLIALGFMLSNQYVKANTTEVFHVSVAGKQAGIVNDKKLVERWVSTRNAALRKQHPNVNIALNRGDIAVKSEKVYKATYDNTKALSRLDQMLKPAVQGVQVKVNGKVIGTVKDEQTAQYVIRRLHSKYVPVHLAKQASQPRLQLASLSATRATPAIGRTVKYVKVMEQVDTTNVMTSDPEQITDAGTVLKQMFGGTAKQVKYTVKENDCVGCIANRFDIPKEQLYRNNPWIVDDMIKVGDVLDLTVNKPAINVKTIEQVVERHDIAHSVVYVYDKSLKAGKMKRVQPGQDGSKKVIYKLTKLNGMLLDEEIVGQVVESKSIPEIIRKGTKVVIEDGTGVFAYPVSGARLTSTYGHRWGRQHKGIDLVGSSTVKAADNGRVTFAGVKSGYGNVVIIDHNNGYETLYGHLKSISVSEGAKVGKGSKIGVMGNTGRSTGVHLHFEVYKNGAVKNPLSYL
ncbi:hypothetical protein SY83_06855 [Paenibacillus swuensis]|uniref:Peptidase M23 n=1 Tax=Paenibacillus swuensis TaxID=1178515 RepID=A0A172TGB3_9BACL|nr:M23 family metallopeptidase [Paenibacillus swuensis]ANE46050.1 hypothetical protein SY83_06855 [Paenibacillus swuensis]